MTDAELIAYLRSLSHALDVALTGVVSNDPAKAKAAIRQVHEGIDHAVYQLVRRGSDDETAH